MCCSREDFPPICTYAISASCLPAFCFFPSLHQRSHLPADILLCLGPSIGDSPPNPGPPGHFRYSSQGLLTVPLVLFYLCFNGVCIPSYQLRSFPKHLNTILFIFGVDLFTPFYCLVPPYLFNFHSQNVLLCLEKHFQMSS